MCIRDRRDTSCAVEHMRLEDRRRRTRVNTASARATVVGLERLVDRQLEIDQQRAEKKERARARVDEHRVFAEPSKSGATREIALENRTCVDVRLSRDMS